MSETGKTEEKREEKAEEKKKISSSGPEQAAGTKLRGDDGAEAETSHAPSKKPPAAAKAAAPKSSAAAKAAVQKSPAAAKAAAPAAAKAAAPKQIRIRQVKSGICAPVDQKQTLLGLGLRRIRHEVVRPDTPTVRGQVQKVRHLVEIVEDGAAR
jgi:large subunit ribosomal protein L30